MDPVRRKRLGAAWASACLLALLAASGHVQLVGCAKTTDVPSHAPPSLTAGPSVPVTEPSAPVAAPKTAGTAPATGETAVTPVATQPRPKCPTFFAATKAGPIVPVDCEPASGVAPTGDEAPGATPSNANRRE